ncbi:hypothetical protein EW145_g4911 [Phellinidium pouzarii]|uniref:Uncharacterized protein n=1 Tax=Phellinidium pouzarii TaxID=167371 RepID=A0A4S4L2E4_9AGAM|nr:hypothetical protein EW145_g4911 [Phellinidium pouzarii]
METRPSSSSVAKTPGLFSTSASASFHSRLTVSSSGSQRRLRALSRADSDELPSHETPKSPAILRSLPASTASTPSLPLYNPEKLAPPQRRYLIYWTVVAYCLLSVTLFTARLCELPQSIYMRSSQDESHCISPINELSESYRLSKILPMTPQAISFFPFVSFGRTAPRDSEVTACLWVELEDLKDIELWSISWQGPLSVVVVTNTDHNYARTLIKEIKKLSDVKDNAAFHIIQKLPHESHTGNTYLNLARLFARTRYVALFPTSPRAHVAGSLYQKVSSKISSFNMSRLASPHVLSSSKYMANSPIPFPPLAPLLVEQMYPIWCSERFFTSPSREVDWEECLWQFWLNSFGALPTLTEQDWKPLSNRTKNRPTGPLDVEELIHRRLSNKFRQESCVLAARSLKERSETPGKVDPHKAQWLRKTCRQVMSNWGKELL